MTKLQGRKISRQLSGKSASNSSKSESVGRAKAVSSAASTGNAGGAFESRVQALRLLHLCTGSHSPGVPKGYTIISLQLQARVHGPNTDDLVCTVSNSLNEERKILFQAKTGITSRKSDRAFVESIGAAWLDYESERFERRRDAIVILFDAASREGARGAAAILTLASTSIKSTAWIEKIDTPRFGNKLKRNALDSLRAAVNKYANREVSNEELFEFSRHLSFIEHDFDDGQNGNSYGSCIQQIEFACALYGADKNDAIGIWTRLIDACMSLNSQAGAINSENVEAIIGEDVHRILKSLKNPVPRLAANTSSSASINSNDEILSAIASLKMDVERARVSSAVPDARITSANKIISAQLDRINGQVKSGKFRDGLLEVDALLEDLSLFDSHQKARLFLMRGVCRWNLDKDTEAATDFITAANHCDDDDKLCAAGVRGLLLRNEIDAALLSAKSALQRFPESFAVWLICANVNIAAGKYFCEEDIPVNFRQEADALQMLAFSQRKQGESVQAAKTIRKACSLASANFHTRNTALSFNLDALAVNGLHLIFEILPEEDVKTLVDVVEFFDPHLERLWSFQSEKTLERTTMNLAVANILLKRGRAALDIIKSARDRGIDSKEFPRIEIDAYRIMDEIGGALEIGKSLDENSSTDALIAFGQAGVVAKDSSCTQKALEAARKSEAPSEEVIDTLTALHWGALVLEGKVETLVEILNEFKFEETSSVPLVAQASRIFSRLGDEAKSNKCLDRLVKLCEESEAHETLSLSGMVLFQRKRYQECISIYEKILPTGVVSELHCELLCSYLHVGAHRKAKLLVESFPSQWMLNDEARHLSIQLGQEAGDWDFLIKLSDVEVARFPQRARGWVLRLAIASRSSGLKIADVLSEMPDEVEGNAREIAQISVCEAANGFAKRSLSRLYAMRRNSMNDVDTASTHVSAYVLSSEHYKAAKFEIIEISAGTSFIFSMDEKKYTRTIDPQYSKPLPSHPEFRSQDDPECAPFLGKRVGEIVSFPQVFDEPKQLKIESIESAFPRLVADSNEFLKNSLAQSSILTVLSLHERDDGGLENSTLQVKLKRQAENARELFQLYADNPFTIGTLASLTGRSVIDLIIEWPAGQGKVQVGGGMSEERGSLRASLDWSKGTFVLDASFLLELAKLGCLDVLKNFVRLYCSSKTLELLCAELEEIQTSPAQGRAYLKDGQIQFARIEESQRAGRVNMIRDAVNAAREYSKISPSYGPDDYKKAPADLMEHVSDEEVSAIRLCIEKEANLLTLDGRLRAIAASLGVSSYWPQVVLLDANSEGFIGDRDYSVAMLNEFLSERSFISFDARILLYALYQGNATICRILTKMAHEISQDVVEYKSVFGVLAGFLALIIRSGACQVGFLIEMSGVIAELLSRHPNCPSNFRKLLLIQLTTTMGGRKLGKKMESELARAIDEGVRKSKEPIAPISLKGQVLMCGQVPYGRTASAADLTFHSEISPGPRGTGDADDAKPGFTRESAGES